MAKKSKKPQQKRNKRRAARPQAAYSIGLVLPTVAPRGIFAGLSGPPAVKAFFDEVENNVGLQGAIAKINTNIIDLAKQFGLYFSYDDMADHLTERWDIRRLPRMYCCC